MPNRREPGRSPWRVRRDGPKSELVAAAQAILRASSTAAAFFRRPLRRRLYHLRRHRQHANIFEKSRCLDTFIGHHGGREPNPTGVCLADENTPRTLTLTDGNR